MLVGLFWHRHSHRPLWEAIEELTDELSALKASVRSKMAVQRRETLRAHLDPELRALQKQLGGSIVAVKGRDGRLEELPEETP